MNKEQVYDSKISPLMTQIIAACQEHGIAMVADFAIPVEGHPDLCCTSSTLDEKRERPPHHAQALRHICP